MPLLKEPLLEHDSAWRGVNSPSMKNSFRTSKYRSRDALSRKPLARSSFYVTPGGQRVSPSHVAAMLDITNTDPTSSATNVVEPIGSPNRTTLMMGGLPGLGRLVREKSLRSFSSMAPSRASTSLESHSGNNKQQQRQQQAPSRGGAVVFEDIAQVQEDDGNNNAAGDWTSPKAGSTTIHPHDVRPLTSGESASFHQPKKRSAGTGMFRPGEEEFAPPPTHVQQHMPSPLPLVVAPDEDEAYHHLLVTTNNSTLTATDAAVRHCIVPLSNHVSRCGSPSLTFFSTSVLMAANPCPRFTPTPQPGARKAAPLPRASLEGASGPTAAATKLPPRGFQFPSLTDYPSLQRASEELSLYRASRSQTPVEAQRYVVNGQLPDVPLDLLRPTAAYGGGSKTSVSRILQANRALMGIEEEPLPRVASPSLRPGSSLL